MLHRGLKSKTSNCKYYNTVQYSKNEINIYMVFLKNLFTSQAKNVIFVNLYMFFLHSHYVSIFLVSFFFLQILFFRIWDTVFYYYLDGQRLHTASYLPYLLPSSPCNDLRSRPRRTHRELKTHPQRGTHSVGRRKNYHMSENIKKNNSSTTVKLFSGRKLCNKFHLH